LFGAQGPESFDARILDSNVPAAIGRMPNAWRPGASKTRRARRRVPYPAEGPMRPRKEEAGHQLSDVAYGATVTMVNIPCLK
jgi:hypothetical protein